MSKSRSEHVKGVVRLIDPIMTDRAKRWLKEDGGREKFVHKLMHNIAPHPEFTFRPERGQRDDDAVAKKLKALGAPETCYIFASDNDEYDDTFADLHEMVSAAGNLFDHAAILSCIPGRLALFREAHAGHTLIVHRTD